VQGLQGLQGGVVGLVDFALQRLLGTRAPASSTCLPGGLGCQGGVLGGGGEAIRERHWLNGQPVALGRYVCRIIPIERFVTEKMTETISAHNIVCTQCTQDIVCTHCTQYIMCTHNVHKTMCVQTQMG
jgi:hypothetical protein